MSAHAAIRMSDHQRQLRRIGELATQLHDANETIATLRAELAASLLPYTGHTTSVVDGVVTVVMGSGEVYELVTTGTYTDRETSFAKAWTPRAPVPGSPAARIAALLQEPPREGMGVHEDVLEAVS